VNLQYSNKKKIKYLGIGSLDGTGKTTACNLIAKKLKEAGKNVHQTKLLGGDGKDDFQNALRTILLHKKFPKDYILEEKLFALSDLEGMKIAHEFLDKNQDSFVIKDRALPDHWAYGSNKIPDLNVLSELYQGLMREELDINRKHGVLNLILLPDEPSWPLKRVYERNKKDGTEVIERLENVDMQLHVYNFLRQMPNNIMFQGFNFETIILKEEDNIAEVQRKIWAVLDKYDI
jgi:thymidylate kinase